MDNPPAFPVAWTDSCQGNEGMALRDWFAGQALASMSAPSDGKYSKADHERNYPKVEAAWFATSAYRIADAMLAEREKRNA